MDQPLGRLSERLGLNAIMTESEGGKPSKTAFIALVYKKNGLENGPGSTIVLCRLYTGRTHQVRIHLQYLGKPLRISIIAEFDLSKSEITRILFKGFPIVGDPLYNSYDWGETKGAFANYREPRSELLTALATSHSRKTFLTTAVSLVYDIPKDLLCSMRWTI